MARSTQVQIPSDLTVADLDRAFGYRVRGVRSPGTDVLDDRTYRTLKRSKPGGPYRVTFAHATSTYGELGRVLLTPTPDGRSLGVRVRDSAGRTYDGLLYTVSGLLLLIGLAMAPLDDWHLTAPIAFVSGGVLFGAFARLMSRVNRRAESDQAARATALVFDIARRSRGHGADDGSGMTA